MAVLTRRQLEDAFFAAVCACLGVDPEAEESQGRVRISWPVDTKDGQMPGWENDQNITFLRITPWNDPYTRPRETRLKPRPDSMTIGYVDGTVQYTRGHQLYVICYGPDAAEDADNVRNGLQMDYIMDPLRELGLYVIVQIEEPTRADELVNGQWWCRYDLTVRYYEAASRDYDAPIITKIHEAKTEGGIQFGKIELGPDR